VLAFSRRGNPGGTLLRVARLFPQLAGLRVERLLVLEGVVHIEARRAAATAACPSCGRRSRRVHSRYRRRVTDEPLGGRQVVIHLRVRRFFCPARTCPRRTFAEQAPALATRYARRSKSLSGTLQQIGLALGGRPGARLSAALRRPVSRTTLLRLVRALPLPEAPSPRVLGVDDWAFRKGHRYGTILGDLEQHAVIELLPDRQAATLSEWLREHPGIEVLSRDRAPAYAEAARKGAPRAAQVADRWHLMKNLVEALERCLLRDKQALKVAAVGPEPTPGPLPSYADATSIPWQQRAETASLQKHARRVEHYEQVHALHRVGVAKLEIARALGISRRTVYRYLALDAPPERRQPRSSRRRLLEPYEPYLLQRWQEGCHNRSRLVREIRDQGYRYGASNVFRFLKRVERQHGRALLGADPPPAGRVPSVRQVAFLLVQRPDELSEVDRGYLGRLCAAEPAIATTYALAQQFATMAREHRGQRLAAWLTQATASGIAELRGFARGLADDHAAVEAGLSLAWSNGQTEGQITKLKLLKRQMYGRASFDLLRRRLLLAS
jgi:transposase